MEMAVARPARTEMDAERLLDAVFERCTAENKFPALISAVIDKLSARDPALAMIVIEALIDEAFAMLPADRQAELLRASLANPN
jgi:hypothetical protein